MVDGAPLRSSPHAPRPAAPVGDLRHVAGDDAWDYLPLAQRAPSALAWRSSAFAFVALDLQPVHAAPHLHLAGRTFTGAPGRDVWAGWPGAWSLAPRVLYLSRRPGEVLRAGPGDERPPPALGPPPRLAPADYVPAQPEAEFCAAVARATRAIAEGRARKIVLARREDAALPGAEDRALALLPALARLHPDAAVFALRLAPGLGWFLGATPETLLAQDGAHVGTEALAGTSAVGPAALDNPKEREEHRLVVDGLAADLAPFVDDLEILGPQTKRAGHLHHWQTRLRGRPRPGVDLFDLAARVHPSPAVGGAPRGPALDFIAAAEPQDRGHYAGYLGWRAPGGDGHVVVALRAALLRGDAAHLYAGAGLVAASDPAAEWRETAAKLEACKRALAGA